MPGAPVMQFMSVDLPVPAPGHHASARTSAAHDTINNRHVNSLDVGAHHRPKLRECGAQYTVYIYTPPKTETTLRPHSPKRRKNAVASGLTCTWNSGRRVPAAPAASAASTSRMRFTDCGADRFDGTGRDDRGDAVAPGDSIKQSTIRR